MYAYPFMTTARPMIPFSVNYTDGPIELIEYRRRRRLCFAFATADGESRRGTRTRARRGRHGTWHGACLSQLPSSKAPQVHKADESNDMYVRTYTYGWGANRIVPGNRPIGFLLANLQSSTIITP